MSAIDRDKKVAIVMNELISEAERDNYIDHPAFVADLDNLFSTPVWGFREITLVIGVASLLNQNYRASSGFYECNPRPLFESSIRESLVKYNIPHRKSGPLNVAKATQGINNEWAAQRKPKKVAESVVNLVNLIESYSTDEIKNLMTALVKRLLKEAIRVEAIKVVTDPKEDPLFLYNISERLINEVPDGGNTPQRIIGYLLSSYHETLKTGIDVSGHEDSASTTNTTSKKPGDIQEKSTDIGIFNIYEVTVKSFDQQRIDDSFQSVIQYDIDKDNTIQSILVICRIKDCPSNIERLNPLPYIGKINKGHVTYHFIDIYGWIMSKLLAMPVASRLMFHSLINDYISHPNTSEKVKILWKELH
ncbi:hypothetical protein [Exiguobacterium undae]